MCMGVYLLTEYWGAVSSAHLVPLQELREAVWLRMFSFHPGLCGRGGAGMEHGHTWNQTP